MIKFIALVIGVFLAMSVMSPEATKQALFTLYQGKKQQLEKVAQQKAIKEATQEQRMEKQQLIEQFKEEIKEQDLTTEERKHLIQEFKENIEKINEEFRKRMECIREGTCGGVYHHHEETEGEEMETVIEEKENELMVLERETNAIIGKVVRVSNGLRLEIGNNGISGLVWVEVENNKANQRYFTKLYLKSGSIKSFTVPIQSGIVTIKVGHIVNGRLVLDNFQTLNL